MKRKMRNQNQCLSRNVIKMQWPAKFWTNCMINSQVSDTLSPLNIYVNNAQCICARNQTSLELTQKRVLHYTYTVLSMSPPVLLFMKWASNINARKQQFHLPKFTKMLLSFEFISSSANEWQIFYLISDLNRWILSYLH